MAGCRRFVFHLTIRKSVLGLLIGLVLAVSMSNLVQIATHHLDMVADSTYYLEHTISPIVLAVGLYFFAFSVFWRYHEPESFSPLILISATSNIRVSCIRKPNKCRARSRLEVCSGGVEPLVLRLS